MRERVRGYRLHRDEDAGGYVLRSVQGVRADLPPVVRATRDTAKDSLGRDFLFSHAAVTFEAEPVEHSIRSDAAPFENVREVAWGDTKSSSSLTLRGLSFNEAANGGHGFCFGHGVLRYTQI